MEISKCDECNGKVVKKEVDFKLYGDVLVKFPAFVCNKCGEEIFDEETSDKIDEAAKKKGLWGLGANGKVIRVGSSIALVINKKIAQFLNLKEGREVYIHPENKNRIIIDVQ